MSVAFVWIGLFTLDTLIICEMGGVFTIVFTWFVFAGVRIFTHVGEGGIYRGRSVLFAAIGKLMWTQLCLGSVGG